MLKREIAKKWVAALRSGEFTATSGKLESEDAEGNRLHSSLGVLVVVARREGLPMWSQSGEDGWHLPDAVRRWAGLTWEEARLLWWADSLVPYDLARESHEEEQRHSWAHERMALVVESLFPHSLGSRPSGLGASRALELSDERDSSFHVSGVDVRVSLRWRGGTCVVMVLAWDGDWVEAGRVIELSEKRVYVGLSTDDVDVTGDRPAYVMTSSSLYDVVRGLVHDAVRRWTD